MLGHVQVRHRLAADHPHQRGREAVHVARRPDPPCIEPLLGRHEGPAPERHAGAREVVGAPKLRDAEVSQLEPPFGVAEQVGRLDVAVNDAAPVGEPHCVDDPEHGTRGLDRVGRAVTRDRLGQRATGEQLHDEPDAGGAIGSSVLADVGHRHEVGVRQPRHHLCLGREAGTRHGIGGQLGVQALQRTPHAEPRVLDLEHLRERASPQNRHHAVAAVSEAGGHGRGRNFPAWRPMGVAGR